MREMMSSPEPLPSPQASPSHFEVEEITTIVRTPMLRPTLAFRKVIHSAGGKGDTFTMNEIIDYVKKYIEERKLYDPQNPRIVYCKGNDLGAAFNVDYFTISDALSLFRKHSYQEVDSHLRINRQVITTPVYSHQATPSNSSQGPAQQPPTVSSSSLSTTSPSSLSTTTLSSSASSSTIASSVVLSSSSSSTSLPSSSSLPASTIPSNSSGPETRPASSKDKLRPTPAFLTVIQLGGGHGETFTMNEIIGCVQKYIEDRKLFDEKDPRIVYCTGNDLGAAFKVDSFTITEVLDLFRRHCCPVEEVCNMPRDKKGVPSPAINQPIGATLDSIAPVLSSLSVTASATASAPSSSLSATSSAPVVNRSSSHTKVSCITAARPSTTLTKQEVEMIKIAASSSSPSSSSFSPSRPSSFTSSVGRRKALDETDGGHPAPQWSCQVTLEVGDPEMDAGEEGHNALVVEYSSDNFSVEYEIVSSSEPELAFHSGDLDDPERSPSDSAATALLVVCEESDIEYLADYSDSDSGSDAELYDEDKWQCNQCACKNSAMYRNCSKCWSLRADWLACSSSGHEATKGNEKESTTTTMTGKTVDSLNTDTSPSEPEKPDENDGIAKLGVRGLGDVSECPSPTISKVASFSQDSAIGSMAGSQELAQCNDVEESGHEDKLDPASADQQGSMRAEKDARQKIRQSKKRSYSSSLSESQTDDKGRPPSVKIQRGGGTQSKKEEKMDGCSNHGNNNQDPSQTQNPPKDPCVICLTRTRTACIIHGKTGHQVCCYGCARRLKKQRKSCPICRRPIQKVVRNYF